MTSPKSKKQKIESSEIVVGVIFPSKKIDRLKNVLSNVSDSVRFVLIDLFDEKLQVPKDLIQKYGKMDLILHKLAHEMVFSKLGDKNAIKRFELMKKFHQENPEVVFVDPLESVSILTDRFEASQLLVRLKTKLEKDDARSIQIHVPPFKMVNSKEKFDQLFKELTHNKTKTMNLPLIVKSVEACATDRSHMMSVLTKVDDLTEYKGYPTLYQQFINHNGRLFKGYVLGELIQVAERKSLPNLDQSAKQVDFNTQEKYPTQQDFGSSSKPVHNKTEDKEDKYTQEEIFDIVEEIGKVLRKELKLSLFGFDVILSDDQEEKKFYVIDVNYFPSYKELEEFDTLLRQHLKKTYQLHHPKNLK